jgi:hypothetical protein
MEDITKTVKRVLLKDSTITEIRNLSPNKPTFLLKREKKILIIVTRFFQSTSTCLTLKALIVVVVCIVTCSFLKNFAHCVHTLTSGSELL